MMRNLFSKWLQKHRDLNVHVTKLEAVGDTIAYSHEANITTHLFGRRFVQRVPMDDIWIGNTGVSISESLRKKVRSIMISYE